MKELTELSEKLLYEPSATDRKLKAKFWSRHQGNPIISSELITLPEVSAVVNSARVKELWAKPGFREWFLNQDENRERIEYLFTLALDRAEKVLLDDSMQGSAHVNMIKVLGELANKFPSRYQQEKFTDDEINRMNDMQLRAWLERRGVQVDPVKPKQLGDAIDVQVTEEAATTEDN